MINDTAVVPEAGPSCNDAQHKTGFYFRYGKRLFDLVVASISLLVLSPLFALVAALVKCTSPGPIFFCQNRVGLEERSFTIVKFRSMIDGADRNGPSITSSGDPRITWLGVFLRKAKIDELPQLWNVLRGDMSLIGPRPELPEYVGQYTPQQRYVFSVRPGLTDIASVRYRHEEQLLSESTDPERFYRQIVLPHKLELNMQYISQISFASDLRLLAVTIKAIFS